MNWNKFVKGEEVVSHRKSVNFYLDAVMAEILEKNTLANWVRDTNSRLGMGH